ATGYLAAFGAMIALARRAREGGSWHVRMSLAQTGRWLQSFGAVPDGLQAPDLALADVRDRIDRVASPFGVLDTVRPAEWLSATPPAFARPHGVEHAERRRDAIDPVAHVGQREIGRLQPVRHGAERLQPAPRLSERHPHVPTAPFARPPRERDHR
ncbi:hypothetical protein QM306_41540, partial [Burkholderia cenocepacia]|nr:hypothetical protein [Burkholderia cenocepacia]